jgi:ABC-2 type transport system ATP-binding protein
LSGSQIEVRDLTKAFTVSRSIGWIRRERVSVQAVRGVSFSVERGEIVGYIGPNGAGKSTTIKMLTGVLVPTGGYVRVAGLEPATERTSLARRMGVVFGQRRQLWWDLPLRESFDLLRYMYRVPPQRHRATMGRLIDLLDLGECLSVPVRQLSLGQVMRAEVAAALAHEPEVVFLDEPTIGLDVVSKTRLLQFLRELNAERGLTVLLTTHDIGDVERLCRRLAIIDHGVIVYDGGIDALRDRFERERVLVIDLERPMPPIAIPGVTVESVAGSRQRLRFRAGQWSAPQLIARVVAEVPVVDLGVEDPPIEEVVRRLYEFGKEVDGETRHDAL